MAAEIKISELDSAGAWSANETLECVQSGESKKVAANAINRLANDFKAENFVCVSATPAASAMAGAGSGPTIAIAGNNECGTVTITIGGSPASGQLFRIILDTFTYTTAAVCVLQAGDADAAPIMDELYTTGTAGAIIVNSNIALTATTQYVFHYHIKGY